MKQLKFFAVAMIIILASCSKDEPANDLNKANDASLKTTTFPFAASGSYTSKTAAAVVCEDLMSAVSAGSGQSITIGNFVVQSHFCYGPCTPGDPLSLSTSNAELTFIVESGDKLSFTYGYQCYLVNDEIENPYGNYPVLTYQGTYWITGGTGRYQGTSGSGTLTMNVFVGPNGKLLGNNTEFSMSGSIRYPWQFTTEEAIAPGT